MKSLLLSSTLAAVALGALPSSASDIGSGAHLAGAQVLDGSGLDDDGFDRRGRGRGRGGDRDDRSGGDDRRGGGHGGRPRVPGCDDPGDVREHPECRV